MMNAVEMQEMRFPNAVQEFLGFTYGSPTIRICPMHSHKTGATQPRE